MVFYAQSTSTVSIRVSFCFRMLYIVVYAADMNVKEACNKSDDCPFGSVLWCFSRRTWGHWQVWWSLSARSWVWTRQSTTALLWNWEEITTGSTPPPVHTSSFRSVSDSVCVLGGGGVVVGGEGCLVVGGGWKGGVGAEPDRVQQHCCGAGRRLQLPVLPLLHTLHLSGQLLIGGLGGGGGEGGHEELGMNQLEHNIIVELGGDSNSPSCTHPYLAGQSLIGWVGGGWGGMIMGSGSDCFPPPPFDCMWLWWETCCTPPLPSPGCTSCT